MAHDIDPGNSVARKEGSILKTKLKSFLIFFLLLGLPIVVIEAALYYGEIWTDGTTLEIRIKERVA